MWFLFFGVLGLIVAGLLAVVVVERTRFHRSKARMVEALIADAQVSSGHVFQPSDLADLPAPIRRYLGHVLSEGQPLVRTVRLRQKGMFRSGDASAAWRPFAAIQHVTTRPPGFAWEASIEMAPWIPVQVVDAYHKGQGVLRARLGGVLTVAAPAPSLALDEGELMRYLAEAPLYPTALLPGHGVAWTPVDDRSAQATLMHGSTSAVLVFHVNEQNEVERVTGSRPFAVDDDTYELRPWTGYWRQYAVRNGMRVPTEGEVAWTHSDGQEVGYWRGRIQTIEYDVGS